MTHAKPFPHGGGDGGEAARASLLAYPAAKIRLRAEVKALVSLLASMRGQSFNQAVGEAIDLWLQREAERLEGQRMVKP